MAKSTLRLDTRRALNDGTYPIQIVIGLGTNIYLPTGIYSTKEEWDVKSKLFLGKCAKRVNSTLDTMLSAVISRILEIKESGQWAKLNRAQLKQMLTDFTLEKPTVGVPSLGEIMEKMLDGKKETTKNICASTARRIKQFYKDVNDIRPEEITRPWLEDFYNSMSDLSVNTRNCYLRSVRRAVYYSLDRDYITSNPFRGFHIVSEQTRMRNLPIDKMCQLMNLETQYKYTEYKDIFMLTFYLIGINMVDLSKLTNESIVDGRIEYKRAKTGKLYSIKIEPEAWTIINKYRGKNKLLSIFENRDSYRIYMQTLDNALRKIGPWIVENGKYKCARNGQRFMQPIEKSLSIYWARYSWATYAADLDIPKDTISEALGHSYGARVTGVYIKFSRDKIDAANRKVIDYVLKNAQNYKINNNQLRPSNGNNTSSR